MVWLGSAWVCLGRLGLASFGLVFLGPASVQAWFCFVLLALSMRGPVWNAGALFEEPAPLDFPKYCSVP